MLILQNQKLIIITPPKTGSNTLHIEQIPGSIWVYGYAGHDTTAITQHCTLIPGAMFDDYPIWMVVRDPYQRAYSLYKHQVAYNKFKGTFQEWIISRLPRPDNFFFQPCSWFADNTYRLHAGACKKVRVIGHLKLETLESDLKKMGIVLDHPLPHRHKTGEPKGMFTNLEIQLINRWAKEDFSRFEYQKG